MKQKTSSMRLAAIIYATLISLTATAQYSPLTPFKGKVGKTLAETQQAWPERVKASQGAPNVVWILLDDVGFGASSAFGGLIETPNFEQLAKTGIRYNNFHNTGICSPTRAALLTGRNSHSVAMGHHAEIGIGTPGYNGDIPFEAGTIAEVFKENGYNTFALGKWHGNNPNDLTIAGPYNRWPLGRGFEHFYGFLGGATDQWHPQLVEENDPVNIEPNTKHLNELITDKAISYIANQKSQDADKPFFLYFAPGATHAPHHVPQDWINKYKGKFDGGWDQYREDVFKRQIAAGLLPAGTKLPPRQRGVKAWDSLSADEKKVFARFFEVYASYLSYTDYEVGRIIEYLKQIGQYDNTLIVLMIGDNGGSKEGTYTGSVGLNGGGEKAGGDDISFLLSQYDKIGTEFTSPNYPLGWSQAANTPFRYWKSDANSEGATHTGMIVHYTNGIKDQGTIRSQYVHVTDIYPTTVEITGVKVPAVINGYKQLPLHGTSLAYTFAQPAAPTKHTIQYYELHGGRSIYKDGWKAEVYHPRNFSGDTTTDFNFVADFKKDKWELYHLSEDWTETNDLAVKNPQKLEELKALFDSLATKYNVYPLHNYREGVPAPQIKPRAVIYEGTTIKTRVYIGKGPVTITANTELPDTNAQGVIFAAGGLFGGTVLYIQDGKLTLTLSNGVDKVEVKSSQPVTAGKHSIKVAFSANNDVKLLLDDQTVASQTIASRGRYLNAFGNEGVSVGQDLNSPVLKTYPAPFRFTGAVRTLIIEQQK